eukprot:TRINITY_DN23072_c0_g2_i1.p1 TRINITY_DN23072_c0_g2~~TRINITY_DN23072_c0_g2_i1.p1  ORF type:complete len:514 (+),score=104.82 TRINITY_DN23072_c0_g2_i1:86-1627(+)
MAASSHYDVLGLARTASAPDVRAAFRQRALVSHPDKGGEPERFRRIMEAFEVLYDETKRAHYDRMLAADIASAVAAVWLPPGCGSPLRPAGQPWDSEREAMLRRKKKTKKLWSKADRQRHFCCKLQGLLARMNSEMRLSTIRRRLSERQRLELEAFMLRKGEQQGPGQSCPRSSSRQLAGGAAAQDRAAFQARRGAAAKAGVGSQAAAGDNLVSQAPGGERKASGGVAEGEGCGRLRGICKGPKGVGYYATSPLGQYLWCATNAFRNLQDAIDAHCVVMSIRRLMTGGTGSSFVERFRAAAHEAQAQLEGRRGCKIVLNYFTKVGMANIHLNTPYRTDVSEALTHWLAMMRAYGGSLFSGCGFKSAYTPEVALRQRKQLLLVWRQLCLQSGRSEAQLERKYELLDLELSKAHEKQVQRWRRAQVHAEEVAARASSSLLGQLNRLLAWDLRQARQAAKCAKENDGCEQRQSRSESGRCRTTPPLNKARANCSMTRPRQKGLKATTPTPRGRVAK